MGESGVISTAAVANVDALRLQKTAAEWGSELCRSSDELVDALKKWLEVSRPMRSTATDAVSQKLVDEIDGLVRLAEGMHRDLCDLSGRAGCRVQYASQREGDEPGSASGGNVRLGPVAPPLTGSPAAKQAGSADAAITAPAPGVKRGPSEEQIAVRDCQEPELAVNAFAGTGKTTSCVAYTAARPKWRFLYVAFNKSVQTEASQRFGRHVECKTSHALAYGPFGVRYRDAGKLGTPRARDVMEYLDARVRMPVGSPDEKYHLSQLVLRRVLDFLQSGSMDENITMKGTDSSYTLLSQAKIPGAVIVEYANLLWDAMRDVSKAAVQMPHDGYLKLYALSRPDLSRYDSVILDECQDTNMAVFGIVGRQAGGKLVVGDVHQSIYQFRGAVNVMDKLRNAKRLALTKSFRFGEDVASVANSILGVFCGEKLKIQGCGTSPGKGDTAYLYRTNAGLFGGVVAWMEMHGREGKGMHLVGGVEGYGLDIIKDTWWLKSGETYAIQDPFLRKFKSYDQLTDYAEAVDDKELRARVKIVDQYGQRIPELVEKVKAQSVAPERAAAQATTAHKAKGLEWSRVVMGDDFPPLMSDHGVPRHRDYVGKDGEPLDIQEANLYYVASTRAQAELVQNQSLKEFTLWCKSQQA